MVRAPGRCALRQHQKAHQKVTTRKLTCLSSCDARQLEEKALEAPLPTPARSERARKASAAAAAERRGRERTRQRASGRRPRAADWASWQLAHEVELASEEGAAVSGTADTDKHACNGTVGSRLDERRNARRWEMASRKTLRPSESRRTSRARRHPSRTSSASPVELGVPNAAVPLLSKTRSIGSTLGLVRGTAAMLFL